MNANQLQYASYTTGGFANYPTAATTTNYPLGTYPAVPIHGEMRIRPQGKPLTMPPTEGMWIQENSIGAKKRKIIEVSPASHVICEGKRHSTIKWQNLKRYLEVQEDWWTNWWTIAAQEPPNMNRISYP